MTQSNRDGEPAAAERHSRFLLPVFLLCLAGTGLLWLLEPPVLDVPAEIEALEAPVLDVQLELPGEKQTTETAAALAQPVEADEDIRVAGLISMTQRESEQSERDGQSNRNLGKIYWAFPDQGSQGQVLHLPELVQLPSLDNQTNSEVEPEDSAGEELLLELPELEEESANLEAPAVEESLEDESVLDEPIAILMPPMEVPPVEDSIDSLCGSEPASSDNLEQPSTEDPGIVAPITPTPSSLTDLERQLVEQVIRETSQGATGELTDSRINEVATDRIHQANALARRGAPFAARQKLIEVLRMVSQAKDAQSQKPQYSAALAAGLRALEEAEDFLPRGAQLEAELDIDLVVGAHRTPLAEHIDLETAMPQEMLDLYLRYAQLKMAMSVAGDPAGSMALYALGKVSSQMGQMDKPNDRLSHRQAVAFQQAALLAHNQNHYAAHELAVLLAESGHYQSAHHLLLQVASRKPNPMVYRNLARVEQRLGLTVQADASLDLASRLSASNSSQLINWVPPQQFAREAEPIRQQSNQNLASRPSKTQQR